MLNRLIYNNTAQLNMSRVFFKKDFFKFTPQGSESQPTKAVSKPKTDDKHQIPSEQRTEVIT